MYVRMGNAQPHAHIVDHADPCDHWWTLPCSPGDPGCHSHVAEGRPNGKDALLHVLQNDITHLPGQEAFVSVVRDWPNHSPIPPTWVESDIPDLAQMLSEAYDIPVGAPDDVEMTHHTAAGPPGVGPEA